MKQRTAKAVAIGVMAVPLMFGLTACNKGGDTSCSDFTKTKAADQEEIIKKWRSKVDGQEPGKIKLEGYQAELKAYCAANPSDKVSAVGDLNTDLKGKAKNLLNNLQHK